MRDLSLVGAVRGRQFKTTVPDETVSARYKDRLPAGLRSPGESHPVQRIDVAVRPICAIF